MPRLIVNADDFGAGFGTDRGILHAFTHGIVTSASLLVNAPHAKEAVRMALDAGLPLGVHLNLADGFALSGPISGLTRANGAFPGKRDLRQILQTVPDLRAIRRELAAQIDRALELGVRPDHLDTHQHFFLFPQMTELVLDLADTYRIPAVRLPLPVEDPAADPDGELGEEMRLYRRLGPKAARAIRAREKRSPRGLFGMPALDRLDEAVLGRIVDRIPDGDWELMVHPGYRDLDNPFGGEERQLELQALLSRRIRDRLQQRNIRLITFGDLTCTC
ncbi:putative glycoside hydrolase/deacetylase ChbG (UPF0249 family) [Geothermobacter ehrlichii]|uniref:Putative glycoside hydrolase/deacetylase ChbG (UPF0249 family) n=1 Tax=Geothermobacter ehrlichii TaxID=213224 RepID=A0A5D3WNS1_9BACT|nr:ChbG/HpnK family deacetylase [Geothermobacter ehrlichii]TYO99009.1 putative glycoside hydrolase/deacetylase ChbG (UPF0249 family) [Geothermobacter ehrlichii]